jgi:hypothetical protein
MSFRPSIPSISWGSLPGKHPAVIQYYQVFPSFRVTPFSPLFSAHYRHRCLTFSHALNSGQSLTKGQIIAKLIIF